ncbi:MAG: sigma-54 dependent transcriptional regulator [bacterium]|nr:sigma-54 dependent transcriptional regulator [bacterium]
MKSILIVDDEREILEVSKNVLEKEGFKVDTESNAQNVISYNQKYDIYILDLSIPKIDVLELAEKIRESNPTSAIIIMTEYPSLDSAVRAIKVSVFDYLIKPFTPEYLVSVVKRAREFLDLKEENVLLKTHLERKYEFEDIVFRSEKMKKVVEGIRKVSSTDCDILITGESGVGKELVARTIHRMSNRRDNRFVAINLSAIPETLVESELFGYEKGAFTDARATKIGLIEFANKGTVFLDEITEVSTDIQVKLLRFIQERRIRKVGGNQEISVDVRIICASNKNVEEEIKKGKFREDLYWRINVFRIHIPPLRERKEDIEALAEYFLNKYSEELGKRVSGISPQALESMLSYNWPGNVRELQNAIKRAIILSESDFIKLEDLPEQLITIKEESQKIKSKFFEMRNRFLEDFERNYIISLYKEKNGDVKKMIEESGIPRSTLYRMIKKYVKAK